MNRRQVMAKKLKQHMREWLRLRLNGGASLVGITGSQVQRRGKLTCLARASCWSSELGKQRWPLGESRRKKSYCRGGRQLVHMAEREREEAKLF